MTFIEEANLEHVKQQIDYIKHITTLATGSILLLATFLDKFYAMSNWKLLIVVSFVGFMVSVTSAVIAHTTYVWDNEFFIKENPLLSGKSTVLSLSLLIMWIGFLLGVFSLVVFAIRNFSW